MKPSPCLSPCDLNEWMDIIVIMWYFYYKSIQRTQPGQGSITCSEANESPFLEEYLH